ncbi:hypothetical protein MNB_SV-6-1000 [hydrothermal vent metagenome]|uniref:AAA-ATPase-like domain-containing protein n=1 Tax=hydrothermal vent metagenome TaxID=652676 RepID=A0A1W1C797_9ZZZZ
MKKIPYGISDFKRLKTEDYYFVDKTNYIEKIEEYPSSYLMFLRPRRFGKSLFIAILEAYYDIYFKDEFDAIFKDTYIIEHKTKEASSYMVLRFDFSAIDIYDVEESFRSYLLRHIHAFIDRYGLDIERRDSPIDLLDAIFVYMKKNGLNFYLLIDEYDNFANKLLLNSQDDYLNIVSSKTASFKQFFTVLKAGATGNDAPIKRMFITGVTPMTMYDVTSGFNIGDNISLHPLFHNMIGLNQRELEQTLKDFALEDKVDKSLLKEWYNNYIFSEDVEEPIYNTDMILYFINKFMINYKLPKEMIDINVRSDYTKLKTIIYTNKKLNGNFSTLQTLIGGESISLANLVQDFSALNIQKENNFKSFMFYLGLVTIKERGIDLNLKIPNETVKRIDIDFLKDALEIEKVFEINISQIERDLKTFALQGDLQIFKYLAQMIKSSTGIRDYIYSEQTVKSMYIAYLSLTPYFVVKSEAEMHKGFCDIFLKPLNPYVEYIGLIEFKYIKRGKKRPKKEQIATLVTKAQEQLLEYEQDEIVTTYLKDGLKLQKVVIVFWGWEMVYCEVA